MPTAMSMRVHMRRESEKVSEYVIMPTEISTWVFGTAIRELVRGSSSMRLETYIRETGRMGNGPEKASICGRTAHITPASGPVTFVMEQDLCAGRTVPNTAVPGRTDSVKDRGNTKAVHIHIQVPGITMWRTARAHA